jgi:organic radical activating enzyme
MTENQRPFQVALGGGEPTSHPEFVEVLKAFHELGIEPNYTTNGMWATNIEFKIDEPEIELLSATQKYCGGVAVSCHPHLKSYWEHAALLYHAYKIKLNFHIIISDKKSVDEFVTIYDKWKDKVDYFVLLPYGNQGRAETKEIDWEYLVSKLPEDQQKLAFGANFYPYLLKGDHCIKVSLYEPEIMSKYLDAKDMNLYTSSFNTDCPIN